MNNRDDEMILKCEIVPAEYPGMMKIQVRLEKDEAWDPLTVLKTFYKGELDVQAWNFHGMYLGEAKRYLDSICR